MFLTNHLFWTSFVLVPESPLPGQLTLRCPGPRLRVAADHTFHDSESVCNVAVAEVPRSYAEYGGLDESGRITQSEMA